MTNVLFLFSFLCIYIMCEVRILKKIEYFVNNVEHVEEKLKLKKGIRKVKINTKFCEKKLKEFIKKIPKYNDIERIKELEKETGIILKYYVFYEKYSFYEFSKFGIWPDNSTTYIYPDGSRSIDIKANHLEDYDILIIDKKSGIPEEELKVG